MLEDVVDVLRCPFGESELQLIRGGLICPAGHRFDQASQGYVNLLPRSAPAGVDTAAMVAARQAFQQAGHLDRLTAALARGARGPGSPHAGRRRVVIDLGAGPGHHLAAVLDGIGNDAVGVAVDLSKYAARRAARAHPRIGAVVADTWRDLPIRDAVADVVLLVFAPRNPSEIARIMRPGATLVVATPAPEHLEPLVERLGLLGTEAGKLDHLDERLGQVVALRDRHDVVWRRELSHDEVAALVACGPSSWHVDGEVVARRLAGVEEPVLVTFAVTVSIYGR